MSKTGVADTLEAEPRLESDSGPQIGRTSPERTCVVTREVRSPDDMFRFVAAPDGSVVPDLRRKLPGRGVWVSAERAKVAEAVRRKAFARGLKAAVRADETLPDTVDGILSDMALRSLSMARKAGALVTGSTKIDGLIREDDCAVLLHASDAASDGTRKLDQAVTAVGHIGGRAVTVLAPFTVDQLSEALGQHNVVHAALRYGPGGAGAVRQLKALVRYRDADPPPPTRAAVAEEGDKPS